MFVSVVEMLKTEPPKQRNDGSLETKQQIHGKKEVRKYMKNQKIPLQYPAKLISYTPQTLIYPVVREAVFCAAAKRLIFHFTDVG